MSVIDQHSRHTQNQQATNPSYATEPEILYGDVQQSENSPNSNDPSNNTNAVENPHTKRELRGAAVASGLAGLVVGGPLVGALAAGGAAFAVTNKGKTGKVARSGGEAVACVGDRIKKVDKKHRVIEKTGKGITKGFNWAAKRIKPRDAAPTHEESSGPARPAH